MFIDLKFEYTLKNIRNTIREESQKTSQEAGLKLCLKDMDKTICHLK